MNKKVITFGIITLFIITLLSPNIFGYNIGIENEGYMHPSVSSIISSDGNILYVGGSGSGNYSNIQDAINDALDGDTVFVFDDSAPYYENLIVDKSINLIGENKDTTVISKNHPL